MSSQELFSEDDRYSDLEREMSADDEEPNEHEWSINLGHNGDIYHEEEEHERSDLHQNKTKVYNMARDPNYPQVAPYGIERQMTERLITVKPQHQNRQPGLQYLMDPQPICDNPNYRGSGKLQGQVAIVTGSCGGIGRAVAIAFAKEGAKIVVCYLNQHRDAQDTQEIIESYGQPCLLIAGDLREEETSERIVQTTMERFGRIDILVLNQGVQFPQDSILDITKHQLENTFRTNIFPHFYMTKAALPFLRAGSCIICTASITAYRGSPQLLDYSCTKGAIVSFVRSLSLQLIPKGIRVNGVGPGPFVTPLIVSSYDAEYVSHFGSETGLHKPSQPFEIAPTYVYLACDDSAAVTGQILHVNGGIITQT